MPDCNAVGQVADVADLPHLGNFPANPGVYSYAVRGFFW